MMVYKLIRDDLSGQCNVVLKDGNMSIPFDPANVDFQQFKKDLADGAELQDADGNVIDGIAYLEELA
jgi:hypothetical protein